MPVSPLVTATILSTGLFASAGVALAQSDLPGCANPQVKEIVIDIIVENINEAKRGQDNRVTYAAGYDWKLDTLALENITLEDRNETTGKLTCAASLEGQKDREIFDSMDESYKWQKNYLERTGYWDWKEISHFYYHITQSAEDADYFVVSVIY